MSRLWLLVGVVVSTVPVALLVNHIVPAPYMDEIFHVPQTQQYCGGDFKRWDPMITTPPGLYFISFAYTSALLPGLQSMGIVSSLPDLCSPSILRSVNIIFAIVCALLFREISLQLEPKISTRMASLKALVLAWYPLHWFFTFLFYTDVGSTTAVMAMYLACLKKAYWTSGMLGFVAILFRQTNVVWTIFVACVGIIDFLQGQKDGPPASFSGQPYIRSPVNAAMQTQRRLSVGSKRRTVSNRAQGIAVKRHLSATEEDLTEEILIVVQQAWHKRWDVIWHFLHLILAILVFIVFVLCNGSIVLGAKESHKASPHFAQVLYFGVASAFAMAPVHLNPYWIRELFQRSVRRMRRGVPGYFVAGFIGALLCVHFFSLAHPYLMSDNRHYTFYIWRRVINAHWTAKYLLTLMYIYSWCSIIITIGRRETKLWLLIFCLGVVGVLVPAPLIEFRYYTVPFYFIALHTPTNKHLESSLWLLIALQYVVTNSFTMYMFLFRPFYRSDTEEPQRFIW